MKPHIGISGNILVDQTGPFPGYKRAYVNQDYIEAVTLAGGIPFILPIIEDKEQIKQQMEQIDGLVLSGGQDVDPFLYGEEPSPLLGDIFPKRDIYEKYLIQYALKQEKPILAICRGMQILNVACGGTLYQDISLLAGTSIKHNQYNHPSLPTHSVILQKGTRLFQLYGERIVTNSFHHQAIQQVAPGFQIAASAKDGVIEAIEKEGDPFVVGIQWHAEMMAKEDKCMLDLFKLFIEQVHHHPC
jgi:putative glutamine amidotransferase